MELEFEKIRTKVLEVDAMVIPWQKDRVWGRITRDRQPAPYGRLWTAAAVVLITSATVVFLIYAKQKRTAERISELEEAISKVTLVKQAETVSEDIPCAVEKKLTRTPDHEKLIAIRTRPVKEIPVVTQSAIELPEEPVEKMVANEPVIVSKPDAAPPTTVKAIIGKVPVTSGSIATRREMRFRKRKIQILPFNNFDPSPVVSQEQALTARLH